LFNLPPKGKKRTNKRYYYRPPLLLASLLSFGCMHKNIFMSIQESLQKRILVIDGAMGTMIQRHKLTEEDYRGERFAKWHCDVKGNNDLLCITQPSIITGIHLQYLEAGADIIETNTFSSTTIAMADYDMQEFAYELNVAAAKCVKDAIQQYKSKHPNSTEK